MFLEYNVHGKIIIMYIKKKIALSAVYFPLTSIRHCEVSESYKDGLKVILIPWIWKNWGSKNLLKIVDFKLDFQTKGKSIKWNLLVDFKSNSWVTKLLIVYKISIKVSSWIHTEWRPRKPSLKILIKMTSLFLKVFCYFLITQYVSVCKNK